MMNSVQGGTQPFNPPLSEGILPSSIDANAVPQFQSQTDLLGDEPILANPLESPQADLLTQDSLKPHSEDDKQEEDSIATLQESLQDAEEKKTAEVPEEEKGNSWKDYAWKAAPYIAGTAGVVAAPFAVTAGVAALGFTATGVAAGSVAASIMSMSGGTIAAGGLCAVMQSIGAAGLSTAGTVLASTIGGAVVGGVGVGVKILSNGNDDDEENETDEL